MVNWPYSKHLAMILSCLERICKLFFVFIKGRYKRPSVFLPSRCWRLRRLVWLGVLQQARRILGRPLG